MTQSETFKLTHCLVVGAGGFVGVELCRELQSRQIRVRAMLRAEREGPWDEQVLATLENCKEHIDELFKDIDTIFYLASIAHNKAPAEMYDKINVSLCENFAEEAIAAGVKRFVYVSSTKAMAEPGSLIVDETFSALPKELYGLSKKNAEQELLALQGFEHLAIIRPCLIYGAGVQGNLYTMMKMIDRGLFPPLPKTDNTRSMIGVTDVARALIAAATDSRANRQIYIVTDGESYSVKAIENALRVSLGKKTPAFNLPLFLFSMLAVVGDLIKKVVKSFPVGSDTVDKLLGSAMYSSEKIHQELGWLPQQKFPDVLPAMVETYKKQHAIKK